MIGITALKNTGECLILNLKSFFQQTCTTQGEHRLIQALSVSTQPAHVYAFSGVAVL